ncbi:MAG: hypothetical protein ACRDPB_07985, partial [Nocardioidaceae bacterium]
ALTRMEAEMTNRSLKALLTLSVVLGVAEFGNFVVILEEDYKDSFPQSAVVFGLLFLLGAWLLRSRRVTVGAALVGLLCLFELVSVPAWQRHNAFDWISQPIFAALAAAALVTAVRLMVTQRRTPARIG